MTTLRWLVALGIATLSAMWLHAHASYAADAYAAHASYAAHAASAADSPNFAALARQAVIMATTEVAPTV